MKLKSLCQNHPLIVSLVLPTSMEHMIHYVLCYIHLLISSLQTFSQHISWYSRTDAAVPRATSGLPRGPIQSVQNKRKWNVLRHVFSQRKNIIVLKKRFGFVHFCSHEDFEWWFYILNNISIDSFKAHEYWQLYIIFYSTVQ